MPAAVSKQQFLAGTICPRYGWLEHHADQSTPSDGDKWRFHFGADIGARAREALGNGRMLPASPLELAASAASTAIADPASKLLFEATFLALNCVARADALRRNGAGWDLIEVKSGKSPDDGKLKTEYLDDIGFTVFVARAAGLPIARAILMLVNREYRLDGDAQMFVEVDATTDALARADAFAAAASAVTLAILATEKPAPHLIYACKECSHFDNCVGAGIDDHLFIVPRLSAKRFEELRHHERIANVPANTKFTEAQQRVIDVVRTGQPSVEPNELAILGNVVWPAFYLDFEAVMPPLPWFPDAPPYEAVPFQYSLDRCVDLASEPEHFEYLAPVSGDWRREMTETLLAQLGDHGSIIVYSSYEKTRLNALAKLFTDLAPQIEAAVARLFDLENVFKSGYCHPRFGGRTSIKKVLPVMVEGLSYAGMPVANGDDALGIFSLMRVGEYSVGTHDRHRANLLQYCGLDTRAMVELHRAVAKLV